MTPLELPGAIGREHVVEKVTKLPAISVAFINEIKCVITGLVAL